MKKKVMVALFGPRAQFLPVRTKKTTTDLSYGG